MNNLKASEKTRGTISEAFSLNTNILVFSATRTSADRRAKGETGSGAHPASVQIPRPAAHCPRPATRHHAATQVSKHHFGQSNAGSELPAAGLRNAGMYKTFGVCHFLFNYFVLRFDIFHVISHLNCSASHSNGQEIWSLDSLINLHFLSPPKPNALGVEHGLSHAKSHGHLVQVATFTAKIGNNIVFWMSFVHSSPFFQPFASNSGSM